MYLTLHAAELWVQTLVSQNTIATIGGRILVGPTTVLESNLASAATTMSVRHNQIANGDRVVLQVAGSIEWIAVTSGPSGSGPYSYNIARNLDGSGANDWTAGDAVFNTGTTGDGYIDLYSVSGVLPGSTAGPAIVGNVRTGTTYSNVEPRWAIGNLNGLYGYGSDLYGAAFGSPSAAWVKIDPTNGVRLGYDATTSVQIDASGNASFATGAVSISPSGLSISPSTTGAPSTTRAYAFAAASGDMALYGYQDGGDTARNLLLTNASTSTATTATTTVNASDGTNTSQLQLFRDQRLASWRHAHVG